MTGEQSEADAGRAAFMAAPLFRSQAVRYRMDRLQGAIAIGTPVSWWSISGIGVVAIALLATILLMPYSSNIYARGVVLNDEVFVSAASSQPGSVSELFLVERNHVRKGDPILKLHYDRGTVVTRDHIVSASQDGVVTSLMVRSGERVFRGQKLFKILSGNGRPFVELRIPPDKVGSVRLGQYVKLSFAAFPKESRLNGRVVGFIPYKLQRPENGIPIFIYRVRVRLQSPWVRYGENKFDLLPGMSASATLGSTRCNVFSCLLSSISGDRRQ